MMFRSVKQKALLFALAFVTHGFAVAGEWGTSDYSALAGDYNNDGLQDILLQAQANSQPIILPYDINLNIQVQVGVDFVLENNGSNGYSFITEPDAEQIASTEWAIAAHNSLYGDFDGNGQQDLLLQAKNTTASSVLLLGYDSSIEPSVHQIIIGAELGVRLDEGSAVISISDKNGDGRSDVISNTTVVLYADVNGRLLPALSYPPCIVDQLIDTDCDGYVDLQDPFKFDATRFSDFDGDGIADGIDTNNDGVIDVTEDTDIDNDGIANEVDSHVYSSNNGQVVGAIGGGISVSNSGKALYDIPLSLVPGPAEITPLLSLSYNHGAGNSILGVGWRVEGLSEITRCQTTLATDGFINGVNFNNNDVFCLNGERLIAINGSYGVDGTEYRTENETHTKITSYGSVGSGPEYFEVRKATGDIEWYGNSVPSRRLSGSKGVLTWAINKVEDREGNASTYTYYNANNDFYIQSVDYNNDSVVFSYETRSDVTTLNTHNTITQSSKRLAAIETYDNETLVRAYTLDYTYSELGQSLLKTVKECLADDSCLKTTTFNWDLGLVGKEGEFNYQASLSDSSYSTAASFSEHSYLVGDVTGDGRSDIVWTYLDGNTLGWVVYKAKNDGNGFVKAFESTDAGYLITSMEAAAGSTEDNLRKSKFLLGDINGDGRADLTFAGRSGNTAVRNIYLANVEGTAFVSQGYELDVDPGNNYQQFSGGEFFLADTNGDGRQDLVWHYSLDEKSGYTIYQAMDTGSGISLAKVGSNFDDELGFKHFEDNNFLAGDINGDGKTDIVRVFTHRQDQSKNMYQVVYLANNAGDGFDKVSVQKASTNIIETTSDHHFDLGDVNGDGRDDFLWTYNANGTLTTEVFWSSVNGMSFDYKDTMVSSIDPALHEEPRYQLSNINGDQRLDFIYSYKLGGSIHWVAYTTTMDGTTFTLADSGSRSVNAAAANLAYYFADITADGKADMVWAYNDGNTVQLVSYIQEQSYPNHISSISNGLGINTNITYKYLASFNDFNKGSDLGYPLRSDSGLSYLVSRIEQSNGIGGSNAWEYGYDSPRTDLSGRGFLGFAKRTIKDLQSGILTTEKYRQAFPLTGYLYQSDKLSSSNRLFERYFAHWKVADIHYTSGSTQYAFIKDSAALRYNLTSGTEESIQLTLNQYNNTYGRLTQNQLYKGRGFTGDFSTVGSFTGADISDVQQVITTHKDYSTSTSEPNWRIRFVDTETINYSSSDALNSETVIKRFTPYDSTSYLTKTETIFADSPVELTRSFTRDSYGNIINTVITGGDELSGGLAQRSHSVNRYIDGIYPEISTNEYGHTHTTLYDSRYGDLIETKNLNGLLSSFRYDGFGRPIFSRQSDGTETRYDYQFSNVVNTEYTIAIDISHPAESGAGSPQVIRSFDAFDREILHATKGFSGNSIQVEKNYDNRGRLSNRSQPSYGSAVHYTTYGYDDLDRVTFEGRPDGGSTTTTYANEDALTRTTVVSKVLGTGVNKTLTANLYHNTLGHLKEHIDAHDISTKYRYNAQGELRWAQVDNNPNTELSALYNIAGNRIELNDPDAGLTQVKYDALGNERQSVQVGSTNHTITTDYDLLNRITARTDNDGTTSTVANWEYDNAENGLGLLSKRSGPNYVEKREYDTLSRLSSKAIQLHGESQPKIFAYHYDGYSRPFETVYPNGTVAREGYNAFGYKSSVSEPALGKILWQADSYDAWGNVDNESFSNGVVVNRTYKSEMNRIAYISAGKGSANGAIQALAFDHDSAGNLLSRQRSYSGLPDTDERFGYDNLHRVTSALTNGLDSGQRSINYGYDNLGNIATKSDVSDIDGYSYGSDNAGPHAVTEVNFNGEVSSYEYDFKGNMINRNGQNLLFTVFNKPYSITEGGDSTTFEYGPDRKRFYKLSNKGLREIETYYYDGLYEQVVDGSDIREKVYISDFLVLANTSSSTNPSTRIDYSFLHSDHLGSVEAITDVAGNVKSVMAFDPWGARRKSNGENADASYLTDILDETLASTTRGFTRHEMLDISGLIHMNGRVYDPVIGRFLSPDGVVQFPENSQSFNRYSYVLNNPLSYTDPDGEFIPLLVYGAVLAYKAYNVYDTVTTGVDDVKTLGSETATNKEKVVASLSLASSAIGIKPVANIARKVFKGKSVQHGGSGKESTTSPSKGSGSDGNTDSPATQKDPLAGKSGDNGSFSAEGDFGSLNQRKKAGGGPKGGTYKLRDADGAVKRTGKSNDLNRRRGEHARNKDTKDLDFEVDRRSDCCKAQRGREQIIYDKHPEAQAANGGLNKRRPVSPTNPKRDIYRKAGEKL